MKSCQPVCGPSQRGRKRIGEGFDRRREATIFTVSSPPLHREVNQAAAATAGEAMPVVALSVHPQALVLVIVEGAVAPPAFVQSHVLADEVVHADGLF